MGLSGSLPVAAPEVTGSAIPGTPASLRVAVGRFRSGLLLTGKPIALDHWRVTTASMEVAREIAHLLGGRPERWDTAGADKIQVLTEASSVEIVIPDTSALEVEMRLRGVNRADALGQTEDQPSGIGQVAIPSLAALRSCSRPYQGARPFMALRFGLNSAPQLGLFCFHSTSWALAQGVHHLVQDLLTTDGCLGALLELRTVQFANNGAPRAESYRVPVLRTTEAAHSASSDTTSVRTSSTGST